jgi:hypothetical protein
MPTMQAPITTTTQTPKSVDVARCQRCGNMRPTARVSFHRNVGMLLMRRSYKIEGNLCKGCVRKHFREFTVKNLMLGWWGTISMIITPIYAIQNVASYISAMRDLRGTSE